MTRFDGIVTLIDKCGVLADVGTDHGYVAEFALKKNLCNNVIASDINQGPLNSAIKHLTSIGYKDVCDFRLGGGLSVLSENEADCAVIAGMGGELISNIMQDSIAITNTIKSFVLQPMTNIQILRKYLYENNFIVSEELIVKEAHRYYFIMKVEKGSSVCTDSIYYDFSEYLFNNRDTLFLEYLKETIEKEKIVLKNIENSKLEANIEKSNELNKKLIKMQCMIDSY